MTSRRDDKRVGIGERELAVRNYGLRVKGAKGERAWEVGDELRIRAIGLFWEVEHDFDALVLLDGDGQHDPNEIPLATACAANKRCCGFGYWFSNVRSDAGIQTGRQGGSGPCNGRSC